MDLNDFPLPTSNLSATILRQFRAATENHGHQHEGSAAGMYDARCAYTYVSLIDIFISTWDKTTRQGQESNNLCTLSRHRLRCRRFDLVCLVVNLTLVLALSARAKCRERKSLCGDGTRLDDTDEIASLLKRRRGHKHEQN